MRIFLILSLLFFTIHAKSLFSNDNQANNAKYINSLKDLVIATQKTRGLTNSYLNGNESALLLIHGNQRDMRIAIGVMESLPLASNPIVLDRATNISQALVQLNNKALKLDPNVSFDGYTEQIEQTLMLAQTISKQGSENLNTLGKEASALMMETILPLTEQIGKMRGMGSGIIAKGSIKNDQKFAMMAMLGEIEDLKSKLQTHMNAILSKNKDKYDANIENNLLLVQKSILAYADITRTKVLSDSSSLNADDYFTQGTDIISTLINVFDSNNKAIIADSKGWI
ncbi:MAG: nitrate- and nitrite sensing domain-containing protein [Sulfurimonas sp.]|nr:nitrate- and nitrite sensing domain-containing protein [Sulfurimonas sp.]MDD5201978.1 nitrate- and nitrite sensing domain-containing protein [Sulfurimonas sp.]